MAKIWDQSRVIAEIQALHHNGEPLNSNYVQTSSTHRKLYLAAGVYFGNWKTAIEAAGFDYEQVRIKVRPTPKWGKDNVISTITQLHRDGQPLNSNHIQKEHDLLYAAACKYFGSWSAAIEAAGLDYAEVRVKAPMRSWTQELIVAEIRRRYEAGLSLESLIVSKEDRGLYSAAKRHLGKGGWKKALRLAGINPRDIDPRVIWTKEKVIMCIRTLYSFGIPLYGFFLARNGYQFLLAKGIDLFGSWEKAIQAAGFDYDKIRKLDRWNKEKVIAKIKQLVQEGIPLSHNFVRNLDGPLVAAGRLHFGAWSKAVYAAGIDYTKHCKIWSTKAWLAKLTEQDVQQIHQTAKEMATRRKEHDKGR